MITIFKLNERYGIKDTNSIVIPPNHKTVDGAIEEWIYWETLNIKENFLSLIRTREEINETAKKLKSDFEKNNNPSAEEVLYKHVNPTSMGYLVNGSELSNQIVLAMEEYAIIKCGEFAANREKLIHYSECKHDFVYHGQGSRKCINCGLIKYSER